MISLAVNTLVNVMGAVLCCIHLATHHIALMILCQMLSRTQYASRHPQSPTLCINMSPSAAYSTERIQSGSHKLPHIILHSCRPQSFLQNLFGHFTTLDRKHNRRCFLSLPLLLLHSFRSSNPADCARQHHPLIFNLQFLPQFLQSSSCLLPQIPIKIDAIHFDSLPELTRFDVHDTRVHPSRRLNHNFPISNQHISSLSRGRNCSQAFSGDLCNSLNVHRMGNLRLKKCPIDFRQNIQIFLLRERESIIPLENYSPLLHRILSWGDWLYLLLFISTSLYFIKPIPLLLLFYLTLLLLSLFRLLLWWRRCDCRLRPHTFPLFFRFLLRLFCFWFLNFRLLHPSL